MLAEVSGEFSAPVERPEKSGADGWNDIGFGDADVAPWGRVVVEIVGGSKG